MALRACGPTGGRRRGHAAERTTILKGNTAIATEARTMAAVASNRMPRSLQESAANLRSQIGARVIGRLLPNLDHRKHGFLAAPFSAPKRIARAAALSFSPMRVRDL